MPSAITGESALVPRGEKADSIDVSHRTLKATHPIFRDIMLILVRLDDCCGSSNSYANFASDPAPKQSEAERRQ